MISPCGHEENRTHRFILHYKDTDTSRQTRIIRYAGIEFLNFQILRETLS